MATAGRGVTRPGERKLREAPTDPTGRTSCTSHTPLGAGVTLPIPHEADITCIRASGWDVKGLEFESRSAETPGQILSSSASSQEGDTSQLTHPGTINPCKSWAGSAPNRERTHLHQALHPQRLQRGRKPGLRAACWSQTTQASLVQKKRKVQGRRK